MYGRSKTTMIDEASAENLKSQTIYPSPQYAIEDCVYDLAVWDA